MPKKMDIVYEDKNLLIINKPTKLLTIATEKEKQRTLYQEASNYVKKQHPKNKVFIVNRLDRDTSGLVVFAKDEITKKKMQENWSQVAKCREYIAIVEGRVLKKYGTLKTFLIEDKNYRVHKTDSKKGSLSVTHYETLMSNKKYSLLLITIDTGRKNQIRVQLKDIGHPIIGDKKYGATKNPINRMGLHASFLELKINSKTTLKLMAKIPKEFKTIFEKKILIYEKKRKEK